MPALKILILLGFSSVVLGLLALLITDTRMGAALACDRASGVCTLTQEQLLSTWTGRIPLSTIDRAEVRTRRGRGGSPQVWVVASGGDYYFSSYQWRSSAEDVAAEINAFLREPSAAVRLNLSDDGRSLYWVAWALIPIPVALLLWLAWVLWRKSPASVAGR